MSKLVRVKDPDSGTEYTTGAVNAKNKKLPVIDKPATDDFGRALPAKRNPLKPSGLDPKARRGDLEQAARDVGIDEGAITAAPNRDALVELIDSASTTQENS